MVHQAPAPATAAGPSGLIPGSTGHGRRTDALRGAATGQASGLALTRTSPKSPWPGRGKTHRYRPLGRCAARTRCTVRAFRLRAGLTWAIEYRSGLVPSPGENLGCVAHQARPMCRTSSGARHRGRSKETKQGDEARGPKAKGTAPGKGPHRLLRLLLCPGCDLVGL